LIGNALNLSLLEGGYCERPSDVRGKKRKKTLKSKGGNISLVVRKDIGLGDIMDLDGRSLVGKFMGRCIFAKTLGAWVSLKWVPLLGYTPSLHTLAHGWLGFIFKEGKNAKIILKGL
jgi:hypothetical protein